MPAQGNEPWLPGDASSYGRGGPPRAYGSELNGGYPAGRRGHPGQPAGYGNDDLAPRRPGQWHEPPPGAAAADRTGDQAARNARQDRGPGQPVVPARKAGARPAALPPGRSADGAQEKDKAVTSNAQSEASTPARPAASSAPGSQSATANSAAPASSGAPDGSELAVESPNLAGSVTAVTPPSPTGTIPPAVGAAPRSTAPPRSPAPPQAAARAQSAAPTSGPASGDADGYAMVSPDAETTPMAVILAQRPPASQDPSKPDQNMPQDRSEETGEPQPAAPSSLPASMGPRMRGPFEPAEKIAAVSPPSPSESDVWTPISAKMDQIKDLYLTAEAIGEDALDQHFQLVSERQRQLIREYFDRAMPGRAASGDAAP